MALITTRRNSPEPWLIASFVTAAALGILVAESTAVLTSHPLRTILVLQALVVLGGLLAIRITAGELDLFNPLVLTILAFPLLYTWPLIQVARQQDFFTIRYAPWLRLEQSAQWTAGLSASFALCAAIGGYFCAHQFWRLRRAPQRRRRARIRLLSSSQRSWIAAAIGITLFGGLLVTVGGVGSLLSNLSNRTLFFAGRNYLGFGPVIVAGATVSRVIAENRWPISKKSALLLVTSVSLSVFAGSKAVIAVELVAVIAVVHFRYKRIPWSMALTGIILLVFTLTTYDLYFRDAVPNRRSLAVTVEEQGGWSRALERQYDGNLFGQQALTIAIVKFPQVHPYTRFQSARVLLYAPIPRGLLGTKPVAPAGTFTDSFLPELHRSGTTLPPTAFGEMYMSFGTAGLLLGSFSMGFILNAIYRRRNQSPRALLVACLTSASILHYLRGESTGVAVLFLLVLIPALWALPLESASELETARARVS